MGAALASQNSINAATNVSTITQDMVQRIQNQCNSENVSQELTTYVSVNVEGGVAGPDGKCDIQFLQQKQTRSETCVSKASVDSVATAMAEQLAKTAAAQKQKVLPVPFTASASEQFSLQVSTNEDSIKTQLQQILSNTCNSKNYATLDFNDVVVNLKDVPCNQISFLLQDSGNSARCTINSIAHAAANDSTIQSAVAQSNQSQTVGSIWIWVIIGIVMIAIIGGSVGGVLHHKNKKALEACRAQLPNGANMSDQAVQEMMRQGKCKTGTKPLATGPSSKSSSSTTSTKPGSGSGQKPSMGMKGSPPRATTTTKTTPARPAPRPLPRSTSTFQARPTQKA
jgi:hypothetical protein